MKTKKEWCSSILVQHLKWHGVNKTLCVFMFIFFSFSCYSQIHFESGYLIDTTGNKVECLIKNTDWKNSPSDFKYKLSEESEVLTGAPESIREFAIYNQSRFISRLVKIDRSSNELKNMSVSRQPKFEEALLFLKVLVEGKANLYSYQQENFVRFYYNTGDGKVEQLVYKPYKTTENKVVENNMFRQQLLNALECNEFSLSDFNDLRYSSRSLIGIFTAYSECHNVKAVNLQDLSKKEVRDLFNLTLRPGLRYTSLEVDNPRRFVKAMDYGNQLGWRLGLEAEFVFPFNRNKWSLVVEPTYQYFKSDLFSVSAPELTEREYFTRVQYKSIEVPIGLRHYFFLKDQSKVFVNASYFFDFTFNSFLESHRSNGAAVYENLPISTKRGTWGIGVGYKAFEKYSLEFRYQTSRDLFSNYIFWNSDYNQISVIAGYTIF